LTKKIHDVEYKYLINYKTIPEIHKLIVKNVIMRKKKTGKAISRLGEVVSESREYHVQTYHDDKYNLDEMEYFLGKYK